MKKRKKILLLSLGTVISLGTITTSIVGCTTNPNSDITPKYKDTAYTIYYKNGTKTQVTYTEFINYLKTHQGANTSEQVQYDNQIIKWLYKDEYYSSIKSNAKYSTPLLTSYTKQFSNARDKLKDAKKAIRSQYGTYWESEWVKQLLSTKYGGSLSDKQAVEYLAVQSMKSDALKRFTLKYDSSTYDAKKALDGDYSFLKLAKKPSDVTPVETYYGNMISDKANKNAISLVTSSYNDLYKNPYTLLKTYMNPIKYDKDNKPVTTQRTVYNIRHLLYALKAGATPKDPWTLATTSMKKMYKKTSVDGIKAPTQNYNAIASLGSNPDNWAAHPYNVDTSKPANSLIGRMLNNVGADNAGTAKTYGSLGMSTLNDSLTSLVPGFAIPIVANDDTPNTIKPTPLANLDMDAALKASGADIWQKTSASQDTNIDQDIDNVFSDTQKLKKTLINIKGQFDAASAAAHTGQKSGTRDWEYSLGNPADPTKMVFSADGIHMIYKEKLTAPGQSSAIEGGLYPWTYNDLINTRTGNPLIYNVIKDVNKKMAPSSNFAKIYPLVESEKKSTNSQYPNPQTFDNFVKTQQNFAKPGDKKFTTADADAAKSISNVLNDVNKETAITSLQKKYKTWWNKTIVTNKLINPNGLTWKYLNTLIRKIGEE